jgi:hypothetical protein
MTTSPFALSRIPFMVLAQLPGVYLLKRLDGERSIDDMLEGRAYKGNPDKKSRHALRIA